MEEFRDSPEALAWLQANPNKDSGFASNRFTMEEAIAFVQTLYGWGATQVVIPTASIREEDIGDGIVAPYADAMVVFYQAHAIANEALARMCLQEIKNEGFLIKDGIQMTIEEALPEAMAGTSFYLWWD